MKDPRAHLAVWSLCLLPLLWLWPCVFGDRTFVPYDLAEFPPARLLLTQAQYDAALDGANHDVTEVPCWFAPEMKFAGDELRAGRLPTWNPYARTGAPLHEHGLIGLCYPPNWIALFAEDPQRRLVYLAWMSLAFGGVLTLGLLRALGIGLLPAWFGAMVFQLSGPMAANSFFWMRLTSFIWLPGVLWALLYLARGDRLRALPLAAVAGSFAMTWLGGFPPFATTTSVLAGLFALWLIGERAVQSTRREAAMLGLRLGAGLLLGAMLAMPQVLPSLQFFPLSARPTDPKFADIAGSAFESYGLLGYLLPDLFGHPTAVHQLPYAQSPLALLLDTRQLENGSQALPNYNYTEYAVFVGTLGFLLAIVGAVFGRGRLRWFAVSTYALLLGLALFVPVVRLLFLLPVVHNVWPMRWLAPATLLVAWLAALGCERLRQPGLALPLLLGLGTLALAGVVLFATRQPAAWHAADRSWAPQRIAARYSTSVEGVVTYVQSGVPEPGFDRFACAFARASQQGQQAAGWLALAGCVLVLLGFARPPWRTVLLFAGSAVTALQLGWHGAAATRGMPLGQATETPVQTFLRERAAEALADGGFTIARASIEPTLPVQLPPGLLMVPGLRDLQFYTQYDGRSHEPIRRLLGTTWGDRTAAKGYLTLSLPDALPTPKELEAATTSGEPAATYAFASPLEHPLLDLLGVRYVLATEPLAHAGQRVGPELRGPSGEFFVFERPHPLPRAFTVPELRPLPTDVEVLKALVDPAFQPRAVAHVLAADLEGPAPPPATDAVPRTVHFVSNLPTAVELDIGGGTAPWLVMSDTFLPGWTATIDGVSTPILRVNHSQRAVKLPAAACRVRFVYSCPGLLLGTLLAGIATMTLLALAIHGRRRRR